MGPNSPNWEVESIYGHIFVVDFHILTNFGNTSNWDTKYLITKTTLDDIEKTYKYLLSKHAVLSIIIFSLQLLENEETALIRF